VSQEPSGVVQGKLDKGVFPVNAGWSEAREWQTQGAAIARILQAASGERCCA